MNKPTLGLYAGSFSPFHIGHMNIVNQAKEVFDFIMVARGRNPDKSNDNLYPLDFLVNVGVIPSTYDGLLADYVKILEENYNVTVVRGLRNGADLEYEQNLVAFLKEIYPKIKVIAFYCDPHLRHISSSALRNIKIFSIVEYQKYVLS